MKISRLAFLAFICIMFCLSSCSSSESVISYKEVNNYFVRNDVTDYSPRLIRSSEELNQYFGQATFMGKGGIPTDIDFTKYNVVAIIEPETNVDTQIKITSIKKQGDKIFVDYNVFKSGDKRSYSTVPCLLVQVEKKYGTDVTFKKD